MFVYFLIMFVKWSHFPIETDHYINHTSQHHKQGPELFIFNKLSWNQFDLEHIVRLINVFVILKYAIWF